MASAEMQILCQALSHRGLPETLLATPAVERVFPLNSFVSQDVFVMQQHFEGKLFSVACLQLRCSPCVCDFFFLSSPSR